MQPAKARAEVGQVAVEEAEFTDRLEGQMHEQPDVLDFGITLFRRGQQAQHPPLVGREQGLDQIALGLEMVVQVAGTDFQFIGDSVGGDVGFAVLVEQHQRHGEDAFARILGHVSAPQQRSRRTVQPCSDLTRSMYCCLASS